MANSMFHRNFFQKVVTSLSFFPVTLIQGSRQVGKSYILDLLLKEKIIKNIVTLDDLATLTAAKTQPHDFIENLEKPVGIDEIQRAPELMLALKKYVDQDKRPGDFVLTGSANIFQYPDTLDSLCGRIDLLKLNGLSLSEKLGQGGAKSILEYAFENHFEKMLSLQDRLPKISSKETWEQVFYGGFPDLVIAKNPIFKQRWCGAFVTTYIERDLRDLAKDMVSFHQFFQYIGLMTAQQFVVSNCAADLRCDQRQVQRYLEILEMSYQIRKLPPFFSTKIKKLIKSPKVYIRTQGLRVGFSS